MAARRSAKSTISASMPILEMTSGVVWPLTEKIDLADGLAEDVVPLLGLDQGVAERRVLVAQGAAIQSKMQVVESELVEALNRRRGDRVERPAAGDAVEAGHAGEDLLLGVDPHAGDPPLAPDGDVVLGPAHDDDDITRPVGRTEQHDTGAGESAGDADEV